jgi:hypothetical protein
VDPFTLKAGNGEEAAVASAVGDALGDTLVRPGLVAVHLLLGHDGAKMRLTEN